jgi:hypothetical protein
MQPLIKVVRGEQGMARGWDAYLSLKQLSMVMTFTRSTKMPRLFIGFKRLKLFN